MMSPPALSPAGNTIADLFGDKLPVESYGKSGNWHLLRYDPQLKRFKEVPINAALTTGVGYWMIQPTGSDVTVNLPENHQPYTSSESPACPSELGCIEVSLEGNADNTVPNLIGYPSVTPQLFGDTRIRTRSGGCINGCTPAQAKAYGVLDDVLYRHDGSRFVDVFATTTLQPWYAMWVRVLPGAHYLRVVNVTDSTPTELSLLSKPSMIYS